MLVLGCLLLALLSGQLVTSMRDVFGYHSVDQIEEKYELEDFASAILLIPCAKMVFVLALPAVLNLMEHLVEMNSTSVLGVQPTVVPTISSKKTKQLHGDICAMPDSKW